MLCACGSKKNVQEKYFLPHNFFRAKCANTPPSTHTLTLLLVCVVLFYVFFFVSIFVVTLLPLPIVDASTVFFFIFFTRDDIDRSFGVYENCVCTT